MNYTNPITRTDRINPNATLALCDICHEHAPQFPIGRGMHVRRICPLCAVRLDLSQLDTITARRVDDAIIRWLVADRPMRDMPDAQFYALHGDHTWGQRELDWEAERRAKRELLASWQEDPAIQRERLDAEYMAAFWTSLLEEVA